MAYVGPAGLGIRSFIRQPRRSLAVVAGVALGVAAYGGVALANTSTSIAIGALASSSGPPSVSLLPGPAVALTDQFVGHLIHLDQATSVEADLTAPLQLSSRGGRPLNLAVVGANVYSSQDNKEHAELGPSSLWLTPQVARFLGVRVGEAVLARDGAVTRKLTVTRIRPATSLLAGQRPDAVADLASVEALSESHQLQVVRVNLTANSDAQTWLSLHRGELGGASAAASQNDLGPLRDAQQLTQGPLAAASAAALLVALFLVYLTISARNQERIQLFGTMFSLGARRSQVALAVLSEAVVLGLVGSIIGLVLALGVAEAITQATPALFGAINAPLRISATPLVISVAAGLLAVGVAGLLPAWRAARITPIEALGDRAESPTQSRRPLFRGVGLVIILVGIALMPVAGRSTWALNVAVVCLLGGPLMAIPDLLKPLARLVGVLTRRAEPAVGSVAVMHIVRQKSRSAYTLGLVMLVAAIAMGTSAGLDTVRTVAARQLLGPLVPSVRLFSYSFDSAQLATVRSTSGVQAVTGVGFVPSGAYLHGAAAFRVEVIDPASYFGANGFAFATGSNGVAQRRLQAGGWILVPGSIANSAGLHVGQWLDLHSGVVTKRLRVAGIFDNVVYSPSLVVSVKDAASLWGTPLLSELDVRAAPRVDPNRLGPALVQRLQRLAPQTGDSLSVASTFGYQSSSRLITQVNRNVDSVANTIWSVIAVAGLIGLLGVGSTLTMSVIGRTREIGLLLSLGARRRLLQRMVLVEAGTLLTAGLVVAIPVGAALAYLIAVATQQTLGGGIAFSYPWKILPPLVVLLAVAAVIGSALPMRRVARIDPVRALRVE